MGKRDYPIWMLVGNIYRATKRARRRWVSGGMPGVGNFLCQE
jgi:hypothetical protein